MKDTMTSHGWNLDRKTIEASLGGETKLEKTVRSNAGTKSGQKRLKSVQHPREWAVLARHGHKQTNTPVACEAETDTYRACDLRRVSGAL